MRRCATWAVLVFAAGIGWLITTVSPHGAPTLTAPEAQAQAPSGWALRADSRW